MRTLFTESAAVLSPCGLYRYSLTRSWDRDLPGMTWLMLNPSTADAELDDATIRRCLGYARAWDKGSIVVVNLFAFRSTDPAGLRSAADPVGPDNDGTILEYCREPGRLVVAAWGNHGSYLGRDDAVCKLLDGAGVRLHCLSVTNSGQPQHPLRLAKDLTPARYRGGFDA